MKRLKMEIVCQKVWGKKKNAVSKGQGSNINDLIIEPNIPSFIFHS